MRIAFLQSFPGSFESLNPNLAFGNLKKNRREQTRSDENAWAQT